VLSIIIFKYLSHTFEGTAPPKRGGSTSYDNMRTHLDVLGDVLPSVGALGLGEVREPHRILIAVASLEIPSRHGAVVIVVLQVSEVAARHGPAYFLGEEIHWLKQDEISEQAPVGIDVVDAPRPGVRLLQVGEILGQSCHPKVVHLVFALAQLLLSLELNETAKGPAQNARRVRRVRTSTLTLTLTLQRDPNWCTGAATVMVRQPTAKGLGKVSCDSCGSGCWGSGRGRCRGSCGCGCESDCENTHPVQSFGVGGDTPREVDPSSFPHGARRCLGSSTWFKPQKEERGAHI